MLNSIFLIIASVIFSISFTSNAQTFKAHIGLNDRLMNSYLLCDRAVIASMDALYDEVDVEKYNKEYDKFFVCSKEADKIALNFVLNKSLSCKEAAIRMYKKNLTCQLATDHKSAKSNNNEVTKCQNKIVKICKDYLIEKDIK